MARISRFYLSKQATQKMFEIFYEVLGRTKSKTDFFNLVDEIISPIEKIMIAKRIIIMYLILRNIDQRTICMTLKVSSATVAKFSLLLANNSHVRDKLNSMVQIDSLKLLFEDLISSMFAPGTIGTDWKGAWQRKAEVERKKGTGI